MALTFTSWLCRILYSPQLVSTIYPQQPVLMIIKRLLSSPGKQLSTIVYNLLVEVNTSLSKIKLSLVSI